MEEKKLPHHPASAVWGGIRPLEGFVPGGEPTCGSGQLKTNLQPDMFTHDILLLLHASAGYFYSRIIRYILVWAHGCQKPRTGS